MKTELSRFMEKVDVGLDGCWNWTAYAQKNGYPYVMFRGKSTRAHRAAYLLFVGGLEQGKHIHHTCRNKLCVNPAHLQQVTPKEHTHADGTSRPFQLKEWTHCKSGHEFTEENTYLYRGCRACRECRSQKVRSYKEKRKANGGPLRGAPGKPKGTHCLHGHEFTAENSYVAPDGERQCRACNKEREQKRYARKKNGRN